MNLTSIQHCSDVVSMLLCGTQLDTIRIYSLVTQLGFIRTCAGEDLPSEVWVTVSGNLTIDQSVDVNCTNEFFVTRAGVLAEIFLLIGKEVSAAEVSQSGALRIALDNKSLFATADEDSLEEVWAVMNDSPGVIADHRWYVSLDDSGGVSGRVPD